MVEVINKTQILEAMCWDSSNNMEEISAFIDYKNRHPLYSEDGSQLRVHNVSVNRESMYASLGDWIIKENGIVVTIVSDKVFKEKYEVL